jgi:hypothetical protein
VVIVISISLEASFKTVFTSLPFYTVFTSSLVFVSLRDGEEGRRGGGDGKSSTEELIL